MAPALLLLMRLGAPQTSMILPVETGESLRCQWLKHPRSAPVSKILWSLFLSHFHRTGAREFPGAHHSIISLLTTVPRVCVRRGRLVREHTVSVPKTLRVFPLAPSSRGPLEPRPSLSEHLPRSKAIRWKER